MEIDEGRGLGGRKQMAMAKGRRTTQNMDKAWVLLQKAGLLGRRALAII
jgi:hypothetical protein